MLDFAQFDWISFDCYGTLIDWEAGILGFLRPLLLRHAQQLTDAQILNLYSEFEPREQQSGSYRTYRQVLAAVVNDFARELRFDVNDTETCGWADSIRDWLPFPDTVPALRELRRRYRLAILSNIDDDIFRYSAQKLDVPFACVVTAQQARSYKPALANFELLLQKLTAARGRLLHVAESLYHDVAPASSLGIATVWVNRRQGKAAASKLCNARPDVEVCDLDHLVKLVISDRRSP